MDRQYTKEDIIASPPASRLGCYVPTCHIGIVAVSAWENHLDNVNSDNFDEAMVLLHLVAPSVHRSNFQTNTTGHYIYDKNIVHQFEFVLIKCPAIGMFDDNHASILRPIAPNYF
uniref:Uncharacterized protein n=1 Tax=Rhabditophanes sp. KR3021 TaxID=114890 RepID=A0AC35U1T4_9BILA